MTREWINMYDIGICDDGIEVCQFIEKIIKEFSKTYSERLNVSVWYKGEDLKEYLEEGHSLDLLYLDIELFRLSGIDVAEYIRNRMEDRRMQIVYISGKQSYAQKLFKTQPMDFLVKPISKIQIEESLKLALHLLKEKAGRFRFERGKEVHYILYPDILYFCSHGRKIQIVTKAGKEEYYGKLNEISMQLPKEFLRIHSSFLVNTEWIASYSYEQIVLENGEILNVSQKYRSEVRRFLMRGM